MTTARTDLNRRLARACCSEPVLDALGQLMGAYGSEGWGFESLRTRHRTAGQGPLSGLADSPGHCPGAGFLTISHSAMRSCGSWPARSAGRSGQQQCGLSAPPPNASSSVTPPPTCKPPPSQAPPASATPTSPASPSHWQQPEQQPLSAAWPKSSSHYEPDHCRIEPYRDQVSRAATPGHVRGVGMVTAREAATCPACSCMTPSEPLTP